MYEKVRKNMKKIYYKVTIRIGWLVAKMEDQIFYSCTSYNTGYVMIENDEFVGFLSIDSFNGFYNGRALAVEIRDYNNKKFLLFSQVINEFKLPGGFILESEFPDDDRICYLKFEEIVKNNEKQKEIEKETKEIQNLHQN